MAGRPAGADKPLNIQRERRLGRSSAREKRRWLRKKQKLKLPEEQYSQTEGVLGRV